MVLLPLAAIVHFIAALAFLLGILFLLFWIFKHFTESQLKRWGWILLILGGIGLALTMGVMHRGERNNVFFEHRMDNGMMMKNGMMEGGGMMMKNNDMMKEGMTMKDGMKMDMDDMDPMDMSMDDMSGMLEGKTGDDFDKAFLEGMIPHHQGAIDMAKAAQTSAKHQEIKNMANQIISAQQREITQMERWQKAWSYTK